MRVKCKQNRLNNKWNDRSNRSLKTKLHCFRVKPRQHNPTAST